jgi:hypothetical protein
MLATLSEGDAANEHATVAGAASFVLAFAAVPWSSSSETPPKWSLLIRRALSSMTKHRRESPILSAIQKIRVVQ